MSSTTGFICDRCCKRDKNGCNDFSLKHTFGYDSAADMSSVEVNICDDCLIDIFLEMVPNARFRDEDGKAVDHEAFKAGVLKQRTVQSALSRAAEETEWERAKKAWAFALRSGGFAQNEPGDLRLKHYDEKTGHPLYSPTGVLFEVLGLERAFNNGAVHFQVDDTAHSRRMIDVKSETDLGDDCTRALRDLCGFPSIAVLVLVRLELQRDTKFVGFADMLEQWF